MITCVSIAIIVYALEVHDEIFNSNYSYRIGFDHLSTGGLSARHDAGPATNPLGPRPYAGHFRDDSSDGHADGSCPDAKRAYFNAHTADRYPNQYTDSSHEYPVANPHGNHIL